MAEKKPWKFHIEYFFRDGRFASEADVTWAIRPDPNMASVAYMPDVVAKLRGLRDTGGLGALPGLLAYDEGWDGYIYVTCNDGYTGIPWLLLPHQPKEDVNE